MKIQYYKGFKDERVTVVSSKLVTVECPDNVVDVLKNVMYILDKNRNKGARLGVDFDNSNDECIELAWEGVNVEYM